MRSLVPGYVANLGVKGLVDIANGWLIFLSALDDVSKNVIIAPIFGTV